MGALSTVTVMMDPQEYREALGKVGLTLTSATKFWRVDDHNHRRWANGAVRVPYSVELALRLMIRLELTALDVVTEELYAEGVSR